MKSLIRMMCLAVLFTTAGHLQGGVILSPTSVTTDMGDRFTGNISNTINQSFLNTPFVSGVTDFDTYNPSTQGISNNGSDQWWSSAGVTTGVTDFDLGASYNISRLALWNANLIFGMKDFRVLTDDNAAFSSATVVGLFTATFANNFGQVFDLADSTGRFVRFQHLTTYSNSSNINEVAFDVSPAGVNAVPEPSSIAIWCIGALGCCLAARRKKKLSA